MTPFQLKIVTPDGLAYEGMAEELIVRSTSGDLGILAGHMDCVAPLGMGRATIVVEGRKRYAACIGGMVSVIGSKVTLVPTTFEWSDEIDVDRAEYAAQRARQLLTKLNSTKASKRDLFLAEARLRRALVRMSVAKNY
jgi:F-type H+-transporting ATPase subunit epsilon